MKKTILILIFLIGWISSYPLRGQEDAIQNLIDEADILYSRSSYDSALIKYDHALAKVDTLQDLNTYAILNRRKGTCFLQLSEYDTALVFLNRAINLANEVNNNQVLANAEMSIAYIHRIKASPDSAKIHFLRAYKLFDLINDTVGLLKVGHNLSEFYNNIGSLDSSLWYALRTYNTIKKLGDTSMYIRSVVNLGNVYNKLEEYDSALSCYNTAYELSKRVNDVGMTNKMHINRGVIYYRQKKFAEAESELIMAKDYFEKVKNIHELSLIYSNLILIYKAQDELDKALEIGKTALETGEREGNEELKVSSLNNIGQVYLEKSDFPMALSFFNECLALAIKSQSKTEQRNVYSNLSTLYKRQSNYELALDFYIKSDSVAELIMNIDVKEIIEKLNVEYEIQKHKDRIKIQDLKLKERTLERNLVYGISAFVVIFFIWLVILFGMRLKKNRIISSQKIKQLEDEKKLLAAQSVLIGQEEERKRIARELHDGIGVLLSTARIQFSSIDEDKGDAQSNEVFKKAQHMLDKAGKEVRRISHDMMPGVLSKFGLREALEDMFEELEDISSLDIELNLKCSDERLPDDTEIMIYRVVQEMVNNTIKHAQATEIKCNIIRYSHSLSIEYADNGIGFDEQSLPHNKSLGLYGMRSRIDFLKGKMKIESEKDKGTRITIFVPLNKDLKS